MAGFNKFGDIAAMFPDACSQLVRKTAFDIQANIQGHIRANGQIDTGFMLNSAYVVTSQDNTYSGGARALPCIDAPPDNQTAYAAVAAEYAIFQNYGTSHMAGRPFFEPAVDDTRPSFEAAITALRDKMAAV